MSDHTISGHHGKYKKLKSAFVHLGIGALLLLCFGLLQLKPKHTEAVVATCSSAAAAQNGISVTPSHGQVFYIDSGVTPKVDANYIGYRVTNSTGSTQSNLWTEVGTFTGGVLNLSNPLDKYQKISSLTNNSVAASYFLLKANNATQTPQTHRVKIWDGRPDLPSSTLKYDCLYTFSSVKETIKALANKVTDTGSGTAAAIEVSNTSPQLGQTITISVEGATGTIGSGTSSPDGSIVWLSPASLSTWPTRSLRLEKVQVTFERNMTNGIKWTASGDQITYNDQLILKNAENCLKLNADPVTCTGGSGSSIAVEYRATYTFRVVGVPSGTVKAIPIAQIASGTQIKHADTTNAGSTLDITFPSIGLDATLTKSITSTSGLQTVTCTVTCTVPGGVNGTTYAAVPYSLSLTTPNVTELVFDEIVDKPQSGVIFKPGSATITDIGRTNVTISDPSLLASEASLNPRPIHFVGPFTVSSVTGGTLNYTMWVPTGTYNNTAYAKIGDIIIGASSTTVTKVSVTTDGTSNVNSNTSTENIGVVAVTDPATNITTTTATINGTVDPNGATPLTGGFEYSLNADLSNSTTVTATTPASGTLSGLTNPTAVSYSLTGLSPNTTYYYRVTAGPAAGEILSFTTNAVPATPVATTLSATSVTSSGATLNGLINPNLTPILGIQFVYSTKANLSSSTTVTLTDGAGSNLTAGGSSTQPFSTSITGLVSGTTYYYKIVACTNAACSTSVSGATVSFVAQNPPANPVLSVTKVENDADNIVTPGQTVEYTVTITNSGGVSGTTSFTDTLPSGLINPTNIVFTNCGTPATSYSAPSFTATNIVIAASTTCYVTYNVTVASPLNEGTTLTNSLDVATSAEGGNNPAAVSASTLTVDATPNISTSTKSVSDINGGTVEPGDTLRYTITIINTGNGAASGVGVTDTIDTDTQNLTNIQTTNCTGVKDTSNATQLKLATITIAAGVNCVITFDVSVKTPLNEGTLITNSAAISAPTEGGSSTNPSSPTQTVDATPNFSTSTKSVLDINGGAVAPGDTLRYTITVINSGNGQATGVSVTDTIDSDTQNITNVQRTSCGTTTNSSTSTVLTITGATIVVGTNCIITFDVTVKNPLTEGTLITNTASIGAAIEGGSGANTNTTSLSVDVTPNFSTSTKAVSDLNGGNVEPGDTLQYTITAKNTGNGQATGVTITDTIDTDTQNLTNVQSVNCGAATNNSTSSALNVSAVTIVVGTNCVITFDVTVKSPLNEGTLITNTATIGAASEGGTSANTNTTSLSVDATPNLSTITKTVSDLNGGTVEPGDTLRYTIDIINTGNGTGSGIVVEDIISSHTEGLTNVVTGALATICGIPVNSSTSTKLLISNITVSSGSTCTITFDVSVKTPTDEGTEIANSAIISPASEGGPGANPASTTLIVDATPDLSTSTKAVSDLNGGNVEPGDALRYTVTVINTGNGSATGVNITDTISSNTENLTNVSTTNCGLPTDSSTSTYLDISDAAIAVGVNCIVTFDVSVIIPLDEGTEIANTSSISGAYEGGPGADPSSDSLIVNATLDVTVSKTDDDPDNILVPNQTVTYTVSVTNNGDATGTLDVTDTVSGPVVDIYNIQLTGCGSSYVDSSAGKNLTIGSIVIAAYQTCVITYQVDVNNDAANGSLVTNQADVTAPLEGGNDPDPVTSDTLTVLNLPYLSVVKTDDDADNFVHPGQVVTYTVTISNSGGETASTSFVDTLSIFLLNPTNLTYTNCGTPASSYSDPSLTVSGISVSPGVDCIVTYDVTVASPLDDGTIIDNSVDVAKASEGGNDPDAVQADDLTVKASPDISTSTKTVSDLNGGAVEPGDTLRYTITIINTGNGSASGVNVTDTIDTDTQNLTNVQKVHCGIATNNSTSTELNMSDLTISVGTNCVITFDVSVKTPLNDGTEISNTANISSPVEGGDSANPSSDPLTVDATLDVVISKTDDDANNIVVPGQTINYTVTITNNGEAEGTLDVSDTITGPVGDIINVQLSGCGTSFTDNTIGKTLSISSVIIGANQSCTVTYQALVNGDALNNETIDNLADATAPVEGGNDPSPVTADTLTVLNLPHLEVLKTDDDANNIVVPGQTVTYTVTIKNNGGETASTSFIDTMSSYLLNPTNATYTNCGSPSSSYAAPTFTVNNLSIAVGVDCIVTYDVTIASPLNEGTELDNSVDVAQPSEGGEDPTPVQASSLVVDATPDLSTSTKSVSDINGGAVEPGDTLRYTLTLINTGNGRATGVVVTDTIDGDTENLTNVQRTNCGVPTNSSTSSELNLTLVAVTIGTNCVITFDVTVKTPLNDGTEITNTAIISEPSEGGSGSNPSSDKLVVDSTPYLTITIADDDVDNLVLRSQSIRHSIVIKNTGNSDATNVSLSGLLNGPTSNLTGFSFVNCGTPINTSSGLSVALTSLDIQIGVDCVISFDSAINVDAAPASTVQLTADASPAAEGGNDPANASGSVLTVLAPKLEVTITPSGITQINLVEYELTYTIDIQSVGNLEVTDIESTLSLDDLLKDGVTLESLTKEITDGFRTDGPLNDSFNGTTEKRLFANTPTGVSLDAAGGQDKGQLRVRIRIYKPLGSPPFPPLNTNVSGSGNTSQESDPALITTNDKDGDGFIDGSESTTVDRDGDGIADAEDFDPQGYFYCSATGLIIEGGNVTVDGPGTVNYITRGKNGFYQWFASGAGGVYTMTVTPPPGTQLDTSRISSSILDPTGNPNPYSVGSNEYQNTRYLSDFTAAKNVLYLKFDIASGDPWIINNNVPLTNCATLAPNTGFISNNQSLIKALLMFGFVSTLYGTYTYEKIKKRS